MTDRVEASRTAVLVLAVLGLLSACTRDEDTDFCKNHYRFHADHLNSVGKLVIDLATDGRLQTELSLPYASFSDLDGEPAEEFAGIEQILAAPARVYSLETARACGETTLAGVQRDGVSVNARYESACGDGNKLGQINVALFDAIPALSELEVEIATPAAAKHFVINRQCNTAIFRFRPH